MTVKLCFKRLDEAARLPTQADGDVGFDIYASDDVRVPSCTVGIIPTGLALARDPGHFIGNMWHSKDGTQCTTRFRSLLKIEGRSGMASRGVWPVGGIIDPSYRGEIRVALYNSTAEPYRVQRGDRVGQLVWSAVVAHAGAQQKVKIELVDDTIQTMRGSGGFGSTGR